MTYQIDPNKAWVSDLSHVMSYGFKSKPRGMLVYESLAFLSIISMQNPIITIPERKLGYKFMAAEAAWILDGDDRVETISSFSKDISNFSDDGKVFFGAYGPKVVDQLDYVAATLHSDQDSRQAVINIWRENPPKSKDIPCTLSLQFLARNSFLHCIATMRSSDLWLGHPYDIFNFSAISFAVLLKVNKMRVENGDEPLLLGELYLNAGSKHVYERNSAEAIKIVNKFSPGGRSGAERIFKIEKYPNVESFVWHLWEYAQEPKGALGMLGEGYDLG